jgi:hypothetical protein
MAKEKDEARGPIPADMQIMPHTYKALAMAPKQLVGLLRETIGEGNLNPFDLDKVKVPAGGGQSWEVQTLDGVQPMQAIEGIILHFKDPRAYWKEKMGDGNKPPDCKSDDGLVGVGSPGGDCLKCPLAQFGTATDEKGNPAAGQACKQMRMMLFLRQDSILPMLIMLPPTSLKNAKQYFMRLAGNGLHFRAVVTQLRLEKTKNAKGTAYSVVTMSRSRDLNKEELERVMQVGMAMKELFSKATIEAEVVGQE